MMCLFVCDLHMFACTLVHIYGVKVPCKGHVLLRVKQSKIKIGNGFFGLSDECRTACDFGPRLRMLGKLLSVKRVALAKAAIAGLADDAQDMLTSLVSMYDLMVALPNVNAAPMNEHTYDQ